MRYNNLIMSACLLVCLSACLSSCVTWRLYTAKKIDYTNKDIHITYGGFTRHGRQKGDEFVFSLHSPKGQWQYDEYADSLGKGYIELENKNPGPQFQFEWDWHSDRVMQESLDEKSFGIPWLTGVKGSGKRNIHTPTARQLRDNDWNRFGYPQLQWTQTVWLGKKQYYCTKALIKSSANLGTQEQKQWGSSFDLNYGCEFRLTDGRNGVFVVRTGFALTDETLKANPNRIEENIALIDDMLQPTWDSLEVNPKAYQFDPPPQ